MSAVFSYGKVKVSERFSIAPARLFSHTLAVSTRWCPSQLVLAGSSEHRKKRGVGTGVCFLLPVPAGLPSSSKQLSDSGGPAQSCLRLCYLPYTSVNVTVKHQLVKNMT